MKDTFKILLKKTPAWALLAVLLLGGSAFLVKRTFSYNDEGARLMQELYEMKSLLSAKHEWELRSEWIDQRIPRFDTDRGASTYLLERMRISLYEHGLDIKSHEHQDRRRDPILGDDSFQYFDKASLQLQIKGDEEKIVNWIHEIQNPEKFTGIDRLSLELGDFGLICDLEVSQWYLGNNRTILSDAEGGSGEPEFVGNR